MSCKNLTNILHMPAKIITLAIQKGGSGKTTNSVNIAHTMAAMKKADGNKNRVLLIDMDPQASLSNWYGHSEFELDNNIFTLMDNDNAEPFNVAPNVDLIRGSHNLLNVEQMDIPLNFLKEALEKFRVGYDYIIIDTPPSVGSITKISIYASDKTFVPIQATPLAFRGISAILNLIETVEKANKTKKLGGIFLCCTNSKQNLTRLIKESLEEQYQPYNLVANIRSSVDVASSMLAKQSVLEFQPLSMVKIDYQNLTKEIIDIMDKPLDYVPKPALNQAYTRNNTNSTTTVIQK
jgi:chromosome partitioning protein